MEYTRAKYTVVFYSQHSPERIHTMCESWPSGSVAGAGGGAPKIGMPFIAFEMATK